MEKLVIASFLFLLVLFSACKKESTSSPGKDEDYVTGWTRVLGIKPGDTSSTKYAQGNGRVETDPQPLTYMSCSSNPGLGQVSNNCLCFKLKSYEALPGGKGKYTFEVRNRTWWTVQIEWDDSGDIDIISGHQGPGVDLSLNAWETKTYVIIATAETGSINIRTRSGGCDGWLKIPITVSILPIEFTGFTRERVGDQVVVKFSTDAPGDVEKFVVMWTPTGRIEDEVIKKEIPSDPNKKDYTIQFPATKKVK